MTRALLTGVAATTAHRDRDELDRSVAQLLLEFLDAHTISLLRLVADGAVKRVERRVRLGRLEGESARVPADVSSLPEITDVPAWDECVLQNKITIAQAPKGRLLSVFPVRSEQTIVGMLEIETSALLSQRDTDLVLGVLGILKNHLALLDYGELDTLTGLLNRKTFEGHFEKLRRRRFKPTTPSHAKAEASWLGLVDIDHFKSINDGYGHLFGDEVLLLVSQLMQRSFRGADQLFRFGGEEFIVLLEQATEPGALIAFERLRAAIESYAFPQVGRVSISMGYTLLNVGDVSTLCVERADAALYYVKTHGRNGVRSWEDLRANGAISATLESSDVEIF